MSSSNEQEQIRAVAERIARRLADDGAAGASGGEERPDEGREIASLRARLADVQRRLAHLESHVAHGPECAPEAQTRSETTRAGGGIAPRRTPVTLTRSPWLSGTYVPATEHPSEERFTIGEAVAELVDYFEREKTCSIEPGGKPCDHCGMCSSRGF